MKRVKCHGQRIPMVRNLEISRKSQYRDVAHLDLYAVAMKAIMFLLCLVVHVPCQHGLVCRAGESITHMQRRRHHMTARGFKLSSLTLFIAPKRIARGGSIDRSNCFWTSCSKMYLCTEVRKP